MAHSSCSRRCACLLVNMQHAWEPQASRVQMWAQAYVRVMPEVEGVEVEVEADMAVGRRWRSVCKMKMMVSHWKPLRSSHCTHLPLMGETCRAWCAARA